MSRVCRVGFTGVSQRESSLLFLILYTDSYFILLCWLPVYGYILYMVQVILVILCLVHMRSINSINIIYYTNLNVIGLFSIRIINVGYIISGWLYIAQVIKVIIYIYYQFC